jgi:hypothetical protein
MPLQCAYLTFDKNSTILLIVLFCFKYIELLKGLWLKTKSKTTIEAMRQIDDIYSIIKGNLSMAVSWSHMVAVGIGVMCIPLSEWVFNQTIDPLIYTYIFKSRIILFFWRTIFYWGLFNVIERLFGAEHMNFGSNRLVEKVFNIGKIFPIIPIATSGALAFVGLSHIIAPIVLILTGSLYIVFGQFMSAVVSIVAWINIIVGLMGIGLAGYMINNLWMYLVIYQGCTFVIMGIVLRYLQKSDNAL